MEKIKCLKCKKDLEWYDTIDVEGSLSEGYLVEVQLYHCENCNKDYRATVSAPVKNSDLTIELEEEDEE